MKYRYLPIVAWLLGNLSVSANPNVDSLREALTTNIPDTQKVLTYQALFRALKKTDTDLSKHYTLKGLELSRSIGYQRGMLIAQLNMGEILSMEGQYEESNHTLRATLETSKTLGYQKGIADAYAIMGWNHKDLGNYEASLEDIRKSMEILEILKDSTRLAYSINSMATVYLRTGDFQKSLKHYRQAEAIFQLLNDSSGLSRTCSNAGLAHFQLGEYELGLASYLKALKIKEKLGDKRSIAYTYNNIALIYDVQKNYESALEAHKKALDLRSEVSDDRGIAHSLSNIGITYGHLNKHETALAHYLEALKIYQELNDARFINIAYQNIGKAYNALGRYAEADEFFQKSYHYFHANGDQHGLAKLQNNIAFNYLDQHKTQKAIDYFRKSSSNSLKIGARQITKEAYEGLAEAYVQLGNYKKAYAYKDLFIDIKDSLLNAENSRAIAEIRTKYDTEKKENDIMLLQQQNNIKNLELARKEAILKKKSIIQYASLFSGGFVLIIAFLLYNRYRLKKKANLKLSDANQQLTASNQQLEEEKNKANRLRLRAEKSEKIKEEFLAKMSHEIRTPMHGINGMTQLLSNTGLDDAQAKYLGFIKSSVSHLLVIVNDILDFSKIEAGKVTFEAIDFNLPGFLENLLQANKFKAEEKELSLHLKTDPNIPAVINGDPVRLNQILLNLLNNAIKFTEQGKVSIGVNLRAETKTSVDLRFTVEDTGIGIPKDKLDKIFKSFTQAETETTRKYGGTGLGLNIARQLAELQGGKIRVSSKPGQGSTFQVDLSFQKASDVVPVIPRISRQSISPPDELRILLVEDNYTNQLIARELLKNWNKQLEIDIAPNGVKALEKLKGSDYDIILMDSQMPEMNGYDTTRHIRTDFQLPKSATPVLGLTANAINSEADKFIKAGMNDFITKPFEPDTLYAKINELVGHQPAKPHKTNKTHEKMTTPDHDELDLRYLTNLTEGDPQKLSEYIELFITETSKEIEMILEHTKNEHVKGIKTIIHPMKAKMIYFGSGELVDLIQSIDRHANNPSDMLTLISLIEQLPPLFEEVCRKLRNSVKDIKLTTHA